jgi:acyl carrier protein
MPTERSLEEIEQWLVTTFARMMNVDVSEIDGDLPFVDFRLDSSVAVTVTQDFSKWLGTELSITLFWEYPSINQLAEALAKQR